MGAYSKILIVNIKLSMLVSEEWGEITVKKCVVKRASVLHVCLVV